MWKLIKDLRIGGIEVEDNKEIFQYLYDWEELFEKNRKNHKKNGMKQLL